MRPVLALLALTATLALATPARAEGPPGLTAPIAEPPPPPAAEPTTRVDRYGAYTLLADGAWLATSLVLSGSGEAGGTVALIGYLAAAPFVHLTQHNPGGAAASFGTRLVLPIVGGYLGYQLADDDTYSEEEELDQLFGALAGVGLGAATAMVIDWAVLSKRRVEVSGATALLPTVNVTEHGATVSLAGRF